MKMRWIVYLAVALVVLSVFWWMNGAVNPFAVERMELRTTDHETSQTIKLNIVETWTALSLHNLGLWDGDIHGDPGDPVFDFDVYLKNGQKVSISQGTRNCVRVYGSPLPQLRRDPWNPLLIGYIKLLAWSHGMPMCDTW